MQLIVSARNRVSLENLDQEACTFWFQIKKSIFWVALFVALSSDSFTMIKCIRHLTILPTIKFIMDIITNLTLSNFKFQDV